MTVADMVSLTIVGGAVLPFVAYTLTSDRFYMFIILDLFALNILIAGLKELIGNNGICGRPPAARACDLLCVGGAVGGRPGMPSGHVATAAYLTATAWLHTAAPLSLGVGIPWTLLMGWSRWTKNCHNLPQIIAGAVVGTFYALATYGFKNQLIGV